MTESEFSKYLEETKEVGIVEKVFRSVVFVKGLPEAKPNEIVIFESEELGQVLSLSQDYVEVLLFSNKEVVVGMKVARTNQGLEIPTTNSFLGTIIDPLCRPWGSSGAILDYSQTKPVDTLPEGIKYRDIVKEPFETGIVLVDLVLPIGRGQRELVIGDRKTGKTRFVFQTILGQAKKGTICIYAAIGKSTAEIKNLLGFIKGSAVEKNIVVVASSSADPAGVIYITPYTSMTIAEFYKDQGKNVLLVLDDLTTHAKYYREISLLLRRFPGRSSYPGDIFYIHSRLLERAGNFKSGSITCLPVAETVLGDLSGYIQTNLMAVTDGHLYFDSEYFDQGRRPAINPFLSVTRVGRQAQTPLLRDVSQKLTSFLVSFEQVSQYMHYGAEVSKETQATLEMGEHLIAFFGQPTEKIIPIQASLLVLSKLWSGAWRGVDVEVVNTEMTKIFDSYAKNAELQTKVESVINTSSNFEMLIQGLKDVEILL